MRSPMNGAPPGLKTNRGHLIKDNLGRYYSKPLKWQRERRKGGATG